MDAPYEASQAFLAEYCPNGRVDSCEKLFEMLVTGESSAYKIEASEPQKQKICLDILKKGRLHLHHINNHKFLLLLFLLH